LHLKTIKFNKYGRKSLIEKRNEGVIEEIIGRKKDKS
jgi:hypothetical protein